MEHLRGYIFRIYPNVQQKELIDKTIGSSRYIYNYFLSKNMSCINGYNCAKEIPALIKENEWLGDVDSCALRCSIFNLENGYKRYKNKIGKKPRFKIKNKSRNSYRTNNIRSIYKGKEYNSISIDMKNRTIKLPKLKEVRIRGYRKLEKISGRIINATVSREAGKYYVSVCVKENIFLPEVIPTKIVGIDLEIKDLVITSDGETIENRKIINKYEKKIKGLNRWLSRAKIGSKNRYKIIKKIQTVYKKLKNARKYTLHKISNKLTEENDIIACERLDINKMVKNKHMSKNILDASWNELIRQLKYKCEIKNKKLYQIGTYYASSQICSHCDYKAEKLKDLSIRKWTCEKCKNENNRDINASINIMFEGLKMYMKIAG